MLTKALYTGISEKFLIFLFVHAPDQRYKSGRFSNLQPVASADGVRMGGGGNLTASWHNRSLPANPVSDGLAGFFGYIL